MNDLVDLQTCERANELISFLYGDLSKSEMHSFELHLSKCVDCRADANSFGQLRSALDDWKQQALAGFPAVKETALVQVSSQKSAIGAFRKFFDLSPLWLKGAVAFATVVFCVLVVLALGRLRTGEPTISKIATEPTYSERQVKEIIAKALAERSATTTTTESGNNRNESASSKQPSVKGSSTQAVNNRRPLSRAEREELAADLRLGSSRSDISVDLLSDRINY